MLYSEHYSGVYSASLSTAPAEIEYTLLQLIFTHRLYLTSKSVKIGISGSSYWRGRKSKIQLLVEVDPIYWVHVQDQYEYSNAKYYEPFFIDCPLATSRDRDPFNSSD